MNTEQVLKYIIQPVTANLAQHSQVADTPFAQRLLLATCAQESDMGEYVHQTSGPAVGIFQMEPATIADLWTNFLAPNSGSRWYIPLHTFGWNGEGIEKLPDLVTYNLRFAALMARLDYFRVPAPLPTTVTPATLWSYYKPYWNTAKGAATRGHFDIALARFAVLP